MRRLALLGFPLLALVAACSQPDNTATSEASPAADTTTGDTSTMSDTGDAVSTDGSATGTMAAPQDPNRTGPDTTPPAPGQSSTGQTSMGQTKGEPGTPPTGAAPGDKGNTAPPSGQ